MKRGLDYYAKSYEVKKFHIYHPTRLPLKSKKNYKSGHQKVILNSKIRKSERSQLITILHKTRN